MFYNHRKYFCYTNNDVRCNHKYKYYRITQKKKNRKIGKEKRKNEIATVKDLRVKEKRRQKDNCAKAK